MLSTKRIWLVCVCASGVLPGLGAARAQICEPTPDGAGCVPAPCSAIPEDQCIATVLHLDVETGAITAVACECMDFNLCHVELGDVAPFPVGYCPDGESCEVLAWDTNGDGFDDTFTAECVPLQFGVCCMDVSDGLIPYETCQPADEASCCAKGGIFHGPPSTCDEVEACCLPFAGDSLCADISPLCCEDSGGVPQGPGSTCVDVGGQSACGRTCGGIAGLPCDTATEFCKLPAGKCCCDFFGICTERPSGCPRVWDPVCGCDGMTYGNECEADAAGVSVDHRGECAQGACCVSDAAGTASCFVGGETQCRNTGGKYQGDGSICPTDPNLPCGMSCDSLCGAGGKCFSGCGELVQGVECVLFQADSGGLFVLSNLDGFNVGDRVYVAGCYDPACVTVCMQGQGCIVGNKIKACESTRYELNPGSTYQTGCYPPCMCPISPEFDVRGGFNLSFVRSDPLFDYYAVTDVDWTVLKKNDPMSPGLHITGSGTYKIGGEFALMHQLQLDLQVCKGPVQHFDSGLVFGGVEFPTIKVTVSMHNMFCYDTVIVVDASPVGACCLNDPAGNVKCFVGTERTCRLEGGKYQGDGTTCPTDGTVPCPQPTGACCLDNTPGAVGGCFIGTEVECANQGGAYQGDGTTCPPDPSLPCQPPVGACCGSDPAGNVFCFVGTEADCRREGGKYLGDGTTCPPDATVPCGPSVGACCLSDPAGNAFCFIGTETDCLREGGTYQGDGTDCPSDPSVPCGSPCDFLCPPGQSCFAGCGELVKGVNCVLFRADSGGLFLLSNTGGFQIGDRVFVAGCVDPTCISVCMEGDGCISDNVIGPCEKKVCGGIGGIPCGAGEFCKLPVGKCCCDFQGVCTPMPDVCPDVWDPVCGCDGVTYGNECEAAAAGMSIAHWGPCEWICCDPKAAPPCIEGPFCCADGTWTCGDGSGVSPCEEPGSVCGDVCGGIAGIPCKDADAFCKFPPGTCNMADIFGICTPTPVGCPEIYDPVCGCNGVTYANECEADAAHVSVDHPGECEACAAVRRLSDPDLSYCPRVTKTIHIALNAPAGAQAIGIEDSPPAGWIVSNISDGGSFDSVNWKVKWGPFFVPFPTEVTYDVTPPSGEDGLACFAGTISIDGINHPTCGDECVGRSCCPYMEADLPQPECPDCPVGDCSTCTDEPCQNGQIALCELVGYACAWMSGCNDDLAGMTRAAFVWRNGECYCWDEAGHNWFPTSCPAALSGCCAATSLPQGADREAGSGRVITGNVISESRSVRGSRVDRSRELSVPVMIVAPEGTSAMALEINVPAGWKVTQISDGGKWDDVNRKVKWGPFFENLSRTVTFSARRAVSRAAIKSGPRAQLSGFSGTVSFDGVNHPIVVE